MPISRTIAVTGATRGLGRALVAGFVDAGHRVVGCGRTRGAIHELRASYPEPHAFHEVDVSSWEQVRDWAEPMLASGQAPELLVLNAGVINRSAPLWELDPDEVREVLDVNVMGVVHGLRAFVPAMIAAGRGLAVCFSSGWGRSGSPQVGPYCASKFAVEGLTQSLAQELPPGVGVVAVNPGVIDTDMLRSCWPRAAAAHPPPVAWAQRAVPFLLALGTAQNGQSLTVP